MTETLIIAIIAFGLIVLFVGGVLIQEQRCARCGRICMKVDCY